MKLTYYVEVLKLVSTWPFSFNCMVVENCPKTSRDRLSDAGKESLNFNSTFKLPENINAVAVYKHHKIFIAKLC